MPDNANKSNPSASDDTAKFGSATVATPVNPATVPTVADAPDAKSGDKPRFKAVAAPVVPAGDVAVVQGPIVLANTREVDPANPSGAPYLDLFAPSDPKIVELRDELQRLQRLASPLAPGDAKRMHELHYLIAGEKPPGR